MTYWVHHDELSLQTMMLCMLCMLCSDLGFFFHKNCSHATMVDGCGTTVLRWIGFHGKIETGFSPMILMGKSWGFPVKIFPNKPIHWDCRMASGLWPGYKTNHTRHIQATDKHHENYLDCTITWAVSQMCSIWILQGFVCISRIFRHPSKYGSIADSCCLPSPRGVSLAAAGAWIPVLFCNKLLLLVFLWWF